MAINLIDNNRPKVRPLGRRLDDAVKARPRLVTSSNAEASEVIHPDNEPIVGVLYPSVESRYEYLQPSNTPTLKQTHGYGAEAGRAPMVSVPVAPVETEKFDDQFDLHFQTAQDITSAVRAVPKAVEEALPARSGVTQERAKSDDKSQGAHRLTQRGVRVMVALGFIAAVAVGGLAGTIINAFTPPVETTTVTVQAGDSLWSIAADLAEPGQEIRPLINQIAELNALNSGDINSGQTLLVPAK